MTKKAIILTIIISLLLTPLNIFADEKSDLQTQINDYKYKKECAHNLAQMARALGYAEDSTTINEAKVLWELNDTNQKNAQKKLNNIYIQEKKEVEQRALKEKIQSSFGGVPLQYSAPYNITNNKLTKSKGVVYFNNHKETYYSQRVLPGGGLKIPGRHVAEDGTVRDQNGYICVAAHQSYLSRGSVVMTSLGPAKVYDTGCAYGTIDIYVNW